MYSAYSEMSEGGAPIRASPSNEEWTACSCSGMKRSCEAKLRRREASERSRVTRISSAVGVGRVNEKENGRVIG